MGAYGVLEKFFKTTWKVLEASAKLLSQATPLSKSLSPAARQRWP